MDLEEFQELLRKDQGAVSVSVSMLLKLMHVAASAAALIDFSESEEEGEFDRVLEVLKKDLIWLGMKFE